MPLVLSHHGGEGPGVLGCTGVAAHGASSSNAVLPAKLSLSCVRARARRKVFEEQPIQLEDGW